MNLLEQAIADLSWNGPGEGYSDHGKRNPIRDDTQDVLTTLMKIKRPARILEVGTAFGLSGLCMLRGAPSAELVSMEFDGETARIAQENFGKAGFSHTKVTVIAGDAGEVIPSLRHDVEDKGRFDAVFIDHEKGLYLPHFKLMQEYGLLSEGALLLADNVIDRQEECTDFVTHVLANHTGFVARTECGLLVVNL
jgi:predicted O-methyltransferase YrrM